MIDCRAQCYSRWRITIFSVCICFLADDESDNNPHDFEGNNSDLELGIDEMAHFKGHNSFTQMQVSEPTIFVDLLRSRQEISKIHSLSRHVLSCDKTESASFVCLKRLRQELNRRWAVTTAHFRTKRSARCNPKVKIASHHLSSFVFFYRFVGWLGSSEIARRSTPWRLVRECPRGWLGRHWASRTVSQLKVSSCNRDKRPKKSCRCVGGREVCCHKTRKFFRVHHNIAVATFVIIFYDASMKTRKPTR